MRWADWYINAEDIVLADAAGKPVDQTKAAGADTSKTADQKKEWRVCIQDPFENCEKIYPIQQKKVKQMINNIKEDSNVEKIVVFGSSVQDTCHMGSDVDFYIVLKQDQKITFKETLSFMYDIWTNYTVDSRMYEEITKKGVTVYERDIAG